MYNNAGTKVVKSYLGDTEVDPANTSPSAGSVFVFQYKTSSSLPTDILNQAFAELMNQGKEWYKWIYGESQYEVQGVGYSGGRIRVWVNFKSGGTLDLYFIKFGRSLESFVSQFGNILNKYLGKGTAPFEKLLLVSGNKTTTSSSVLGIEMPSIFTYAALIGAAYFLIPPIIRELKKK